LLEQDVALLLGDLERLGCNIELGLQLDLHEHLRADRLAQRISLALLGVLGAQLLGRRRRLAISRAGKRQHNGRNHDSHEAGRKNGPHQKSPCPEPARVFVAVIFTVSLFGTVPVCWIWPATEICDSNADDTPRPVTRSTAVTAMPTTAPLSVSEPGDESGAPAAQRGPGSMKSSEDRITSRSPWLIGGRRKRRRLPYLP
jgi:hypothetical protein